MTSQLRPLAFAGLVGLLAPALSALTFVPVADDDLADHAGVIVHGRVIESATEATANGPVTAYRTAVIAMLKGTAVDEVTVTMPGGALEDDRWLQLPGLPTLAAGDEVLLFLTPAGSRYRVTHLSQGIFHAGWWQGERHWTRSLHGAHALTLEGAVPAAAKAAERYPLARRADAFERWLSDRARGIARDADYLADAAVRPAVPAAKFTLRSQHNMLRWHGFDEGETVTWWRNNRGQAGAADGGEGAFRAALRVWSDEPSTPIALSDGGTTDFVVRFPGIDGQNTIQFDAAVGAFDRDFDCATGGTIAMNFIVVGMLQRTWKGEIFRNINEADIMINDGVACRAGDRSFLETVYTHELGHTLGLGHACGDATSPPCQSSPRLADAVMRAEIAEPPMGARLGSDDVAGIRYLYDPRFTEQTPDPFCDLLPGDPRFCTDCGPCDEGQGDCDRDAECAVGLACTDNVGAQFGYAPGIDVCLADGAPQQPDDPSCPALGTGRYCTDCGPCASGQGDCDRDTECASGLECVDDVGAQFGFGPGVDVCLPSSGGCSSPLGAGDFCSACGPCGAGEGDCDRDAECGPGLACVDNVGAMFGFGPNVDVCM